MEIVYCAGCQSRVTGTDLERGRAFRSGDRVLCLACAPAPLAAAALKAASPSPRPASSTSLPKMGTARRGSAPAARRPLSPVLVGGLVGAAAIALALAFLMSGRSEPPAPRPAPPLPVAPHPARDSAREKRHAQEWSALETQTKEACDREEFGRAVGILESAIQSSTDPDWTWMVQKRLTEVRTRAKSLFGDLYPRALEAKKKGAGAEAEALVRRVALWKLPECQIVLPENAPPSPAPAPSPEPAPAPAPEKPPSLSVFDGGLAPGWRDWSYSTKRDFEAQAPGAEGRKTLSVIYERNGAGLYFHSEQPLEASRYLALEFSSRAEGESPSMIVTVTRNLPTQDIALTGGVRFLLHRSLPAPARSYVFSASV